jgi:hypothetical protein
MYAGLLTTARLLPAYSEPVGTFCSLYHMPADKGRLNSKCQPYSSICMSSKEFIPEEWGIEPEEQKKRKIKIFLIHACASLKCPRSSAKSSLRANAPASSITSLAQPSIPALIFLHQSAASEKNCESMPTEHLKFCSAVSSSNQLECYHHQIQYLPLLQLSSYAAE